MTSQPAFGQPVSALGVAYAHTVAFSGIDVKPVDVQVQISAGLPAFTIVGLADKAVGESRERVRSALGALGIGLPTKRITVNLAPADLLKEGSHFDLPIALAMLVAIGAIPADSARGYLALGELALDGAIRAVSGVLPAALAAAGHGLGLICPGACGGEAAWLGSDVEVLASATLLGLINHFNGTQVLSPPTPQLRDQLPGYPELSEIKGQETAKRALEIAAAGNHNLLQFRTIGPPTLLCLLTPGAHPCSLIAQRLDLLAHAVGQVGDEDVGEGLLEASCLPLKLAGPRLRQRRELAQVGTADLSTRANGEGRARSVPARTIRSGKCR
jgi:magnesium chelatase family protein